ncbi:hypothetical protein [Methanobacterium oryzae]|uniref:hypothetical protein n=1 Tax=Methanobacterium oryzae TaxID=69540 RepID=UPI003D20E1B3
MADDLDIGGTLKVIEEQINSLSEKIKTGRIKDPKHEEIRIKMIRTLGYLSKTYIELLEAEKLEELEEEINKIKETIIFGK